MNTGGGEAVLGCPCSGSDRGRDFITWNGPYSAFEVTQQLRHQLASGNLIDASIPYHSDELSFDLNQAGEEEYRSESNRRLEIVHRQRPDPVVTGHRRREC